ncbi:MAG: gluconolactonase [Rhodobacteraceae bacterium]|nr:gluconolactonase [Paracoccaceae bacterium]MBR29257.1 gluconolactonase [Paracoccaceae bacterium]
MTAPLPVPNPASAASTHDPRPCHLGEGPLWHPERNQLFWFDILENRLRSSDASGPLEWGFPGHVSAAGWVDRDRLLVAGETGLSLLDLDSGAVEPVAPLEADDPATRSNDGRADPWGGFWIGTMGKRAEPGAGAIYRFHRGEIRKLHPGITIPNAICFSPDGGFAHFADTARRTVWRQRLNPADGWPCGDPEPFLDLRPLGLNPDGAVIDADGRMWLALWGAGRVAVIPPQGGITEGPSFPAAHVSCPAFGGADLSTLFVTTAQEGLDLSDPAHAGAGMVYAAQVEAKGLPEPRVIL